MCPRRTGSAFGVGAYYKAEQLQKLRGELATYEHHSDESDALRLVPFRASVGATARGRRGVRDELARAAYSTLMFAALTTFSQRPRSSRTCSKNSRDELPTGSMPRTP